MINERIELDEKYYDLTTALIKVLNNRSLLSKEKLVIGICGESGSGKSVTAICLQRILAKSHIPTLALHQDSYFKLPPKENHEKRKADLNWVGPQEVQLDWMQRHIASFKSGGEALMAPVLDYEKNVFLQQAVNIKKTSILIVEGVYAFLLADFDFKIFMERTYKDTLEKRKKRSREAYDPFVEQVLAIEHSLVAPLKMQADVVVKKDYSL